MHAYFDFKHIALNKFSFIERYMFKIDHKKNINNGIWRIKGFHQDVWGSNLHPQNGASRSTYNGRVSGVG